MINPRDVTDRKQLEQQLTRQAFSDSLTGLANRALFNDRLDNAVERAQRDRGLVGLLFIDLDGFKVVNDGLGHQTGDRLLTAVADRVDASVRGGDTAARLGGDESAIIGC